MTNLDTQNATSVEEKKQEPVKSKQSLLLPISIVLAGFFLGGGMLGAALILGGSSGSGDQGITEPVRADITYEQITAADHIRGSLEAPVKLVDYSDLECPYCKRHHDTLLSLANSYEGSEFAWVYRHFPLEQLHAKAIPEAVASECVADLAGEEGFWNFVDTIYEVTPSNDGLDLARLPEYAQAAGVTDLAAFQSCYDSRETLSEVEADIVDATNAGGRGTPYGLLVSEAEITRGARNDIFAIMQDIGAGGLATFSERGHAVGISGALPIETVAAIVDRLLELNN